MLASFCIKRTFYKLDVSLYVDCEKQLASLMVRYDRLIMKVEDKITYADVDRPEKAEAWLGKPIHTQAGDVPLLEWLEAHYKRQQAA